ncbi:MAG TPA: 50S ribosomal protein L11 methyltransferase [Stellaceae bacterium]|nr:50S ribosomal protein L11 methyltransferase [Stellaceae bacterium]
MAGFWHLSATVRGADAAAALADLLDEAGAAVAAFETDEATAEWRIDAYGTDRLLTPPLEVRLSLAAAAAAGALLQIHEERLRERDWLAENRLAFPPLRLARFFVHGSHYDGRIPAGAVGIEVDAATAFGTGEHPSTRGCFLALDLLARRRRFRRPLDIGTGTGILAIAAAKTLRRPVVARDIDAAAVRLARRNAHKNGLASWIRLEAGTGYRGRRLAGQRYDLVFANILARPLAHMARDLAGKLAPGGLAVLSGLLRRQEPLVLAAHRLSRLTLERRILVEGWSTLILSKNP